MKVKRLLAGFVATAMTVGMIPALAFADETVNDSSVAQTDVQEVRHDKTAKVDARAVAMKAKTLNISLDKLTVSNITVSDGEWSETLSIDELRNVSASAAMK